MSKINHIYRLVKESGWIATGQLLALFGGFLGIKILTSHLGSAGYGELALGMTLVGLINMFIYGPIGQVVLRYYSIFRDRDELNIYFFLIKKIHKKIALLLLIFSILCGTLVFVFVKNQWWVIVITAILFGIVNGINVTFNSLQSAIRQRKIVAIHQGVEACCKPLFALLIIYYLNSRGYSALLGFFITTSLILCSQSFFVYRNIQIRKHIKVPPPFNKLAKKRIRELLKYGLSIIVLAFFAAICTYADRWILKGAFSSREVGIYAAMYQIANAPIMLLFGVINQLMVPIIFESAGTLSSEEQVVSGMRLLARTLVISSVTMIAIVMLTYNYSEYIVGILTTPEFAKYHDVLWIMVLSISLFNISQLYFLKALIFNKPKIILPAWIVRTIIFIGLGIYMTNLNGILGMSIALCISSLFFLVIIIFITSRINIKDQLIN